MSSASQFLGEIRSASARGAFATALGLAARLPEHMRDGVIAGLMREHQLETCTVCEGEGSWEVSFGWGEGEECERDIACPVCEEHGATTPEDRREWSEELDMGIEAQERLTKQAEADPDFWSRSDEWDY